MLTILAFAMLIALPTTAKAYTFQYGSDGNSYNGNSYNSYNNTYGYNNTANPIPIVYSITPNRVSGVAGNMAVVLSGANFVQGSMAEFNGSYRATNFNNQNQLTVTLNAADVTNPGSYVISVFNPMPGGGTSNGIFFNVESVAQVTNTSVTTAPLHSTASQQTAAPKQSTDSSSESSLAGNAILASNGFLPSNLFQWILAAILILLMVILIRKAYGAEDKYHKSPLKHA